MLSIKPRTPEISMLLFGKTLSNDEAYKITKAVCEQEGWPLDEPLSVQNGFFTWAITTNSNMIGSNVRIKVRKRDRVILERAFLPR
jgi:hypothetical protein